MKNSPCCPKCECRVLYHVTRVKVPDARYSQTDRFTDLTLTGLSSVKIVGLEAWVCSGCGYSELFAQNQNVLAEMAKMGHGVRVIDRTNDDGPFR